MGDLRLRRTLFQVAGVLVLLLSTILLARAAGPDCWVPARWQGGPLEVLRRAGSKQVLADPARAGILRDWYNPRTLDLLENTPVNCLL